MNDILFFVVLVGAFLIPPLVFKQLWLFGVFMVFFCCFGVMEWLAIKTTGSSISQKFWKLRKENRKGAWIIIIGMAVAWIVLLAHFMIK